MALESNVLLINALTNLIQSMVSLKLVIVRVAFFLGHPVYGIFVLILLGHYDSKMLISKRHGENGFRDLSEGLGNKDKVSCVWL